MKLSEEIKRKIERAFLENDLIGDMAFSDGEYQALLAYTRSFVIPFLRRKYRLLTS